ncbi:MAG: DUF2442 domain-containing protein [Deltaproteobacteria bacterium]|nr:DUF2442 domain-containing protein [Deltaproteobacteria bacterium]
MKVNNVEAIQPATLKVELSTGKTLVVDVSSYITSPGYERIAEPSLFTKVQVEEWGHGVEWREIDMGIDVDTLYRLSREQAGKAFPTEAFNSWMKKNSLSLTTAAQALGLTRRTVIYYHCGHKPIPIYIGLACDGWESRQRASRGFKRPAAKSRQSSLAVA